MIVDTLENFKLYFGINPHFKTAHAFIVDCIKTPRIVGKYEINKDVFALVQEYAPRTDPSFESHKEYIDVQFIISGSEIIETSPISLLTITEDQTPAKDALLYSNPKQKSTQTLNQNDFAIFYPQDGHRPSLALNHDNIKKIVVKIKL